MGLHSDNVDDVATSSNFKELPKTHQKDDNFSLEIEYEAGGGPALCWLEPQQTAIKSSLTCILRQSVPIQSYLIALAVGHIKSAAIGPRSEVWAEPSVLDSAQKEFQGMENPCLTFVTPCIIVGDKSLTDVVIHEITHSWFGNLVTNANWSEFWLNEGFTMFGQRRISETLHGRQAMCLEATTGQSLLHRHIEHKGHDHPLTRLRVIIEKGVDPDETYNETPYEKGFLSLAIYRVCFDIATHCDVSFDIATHCDVSFDIATHCDVSFDIATHCDVSFDIAAYFDIGFDIATYFDIGFDIATYFDIGFDIATYFDIGFDIATYFDIGFDIETQHK
ncbi:hypothetical protein Btru_054664 [Bulinus truncatus]|nr:hypothetical protein Btru_054664 [Bulinus truncatus]